MSTVAILPVKRFALSKRRLAVGLSDGDRRALVVAMFSDVLVALGRCRAVDRVLVVTDDRRAQQLAAGYGAAVSDDGRSSHSDAALRGMEQAVSEGAQRLLLVAGDCPLLDPAELGALVQRLRELQAGAGERGALLIVPDRHGSGTNALAFDLPAPITPAFGPGSRDRHAGSAAAAGALYELASVPSLALDVDTPEDLGALEAELATRHGGAAHTRGMLAQLARSAPGR